MASKQKHLALSTLLAATFMGIIDTSIINVASPSIQKTLPASFEQVQLIIAGYVIAYGIGLVVGGRLGDAYGRKCIFQIGLASFVIMSLACAIAPNAPLLIIARILQGLSGAFMLPQVLSTIQVLYNGPARAKVLGYYGATIGIASIAGQIVGGALISLNLFNLGWRWVFLVNIPIGLIALAASIRNVPESKSSTPVKIDVGGSLLLALTIGALLYPLVATLHVGWSAGFTAMIILSVVAAISFLKWERKVEGRNKEPLVRLGLFKQSSFRVGMLTVLAFYGGNAGLYLVLAYFFQSGLHLTPLVSGIGYAPLGIGFMVASLFSKRLVEKYGMKVLISGAGLMMLSFVLLGLLLNHNPSPLSFSIPLLISGIGEGLIAVTLIGKVLAGIDSSIAGLASGALLTMTQIANVLSVILTGTLFSSLLARRNGDHTYAYAFGGCLIWLFVLAAVAAGLLKHLDRIEKSELLLSEHF
jgi:EmrB/QacA subfamily drug resistance transporter